MFIIKRSDKYYITPSYTEEIEDDEDDDPHPTLWPYGVSKERDKARGFETKEDALKFIEWIIEESKFLGVKNVHKYTVVEDDK